MFLYIVDTDSLIYNYAQTGYRIRKGTDLISPSWYIYASVICVTIGSGNGLSHVGRQAITWTNVYLSSIKPSWINFNYIWIEIQKIFIHENEFENFVYETASAILSKGGNLDWGEVYRYILCFGVAFLVHIGH